MARPALRGSMKSWLGMPKLLPLPLPLTPLQIAVSDGRVTVDNPNPASLAAMLPPAAIHGAWAGLIVLFR